MNHHQKQYALERAKEVYRIKWNEADEKYKIPAVVIDGQKKLDLIYQGKVKLRPKHLVSPREYLIEAYDFSKLESKQSYAPKFKIITERLLKLYTDAKDQIMLGDCDEAIKLIKQLEAIEI